MKSPELGLVCITASDAVRYRVITRKRLLQLGVNEQREALRRLYADNLARLSGALDFCHARRINLYRLTSALFPFADDPVGEDVLDEISAQIQSVGKRALELKIRVVLHP